MRPLRRPPLGRSTGWPTLPDPPAPEVIVGPDGRRHFIRYRMLRMPTAVIALTEELSVPDGSGHRLEIHCNHFADPGLLLPRIQAQVRAAIAHPYVELNEWHAWNLPGHELGGRLEEAEDPEDVDDAEDTAGPRLVVDGRSLSWEELGNLLKPYVG